jgi:bifunctional non-homologous end joining protein LigD
VPEPKAKATFIPPMLLLPAAALPEGKAWSYELELDGFRALAVKTAGSILLRSRNDKDFNRRYPGVVRGLANLPDETVLDGEIVPWTSRGGHLSPRSRTSARPWLRFSTTFSTFWFWPVTM